VIFKTHVLCCKKLLEQEEAGEGPAKNLKVEQVFIQAQEYSQQSQTLQFAVKTSLTFGQRRQAN
jgi:hypothetical protein